MLVVAGFAVLTVVSLLGDQVQGTAALDGLRGAVGRVIGPDSATTTLQAVATSMVTITSITFSVLLLAVQQTASTLSPVVFDQFIRRKGNQAFLGFFVGLTIFAFVTSAAVQGSTPPLIGAALGDDADRRRVDLPAPSRLLDDQPDAAHQRHPDDPRPDPGRSWPRGSTRPPHPAEQLQRASGTRTSDVAQQRVRHPCPPRGAGGRAARHGGR